MDLFLGVDLGTSSVRTIAIDTSGEIRALSQVEYDISIPHPSWAEQSPELWYSCAARTIREALAAAGEGCAVRGLGFSGQMHGLVALDKQGKPVRDAILWCDQRASGEISEIYGAVGKERIAAITHSPVASGFMAGSLLWLRKRERESWDRIACAMLPKDYLRFRLTGRIASDVTDAAGTGLFDCNAFSWSQEIISALNIPLPFFPQLGYPSEIAGNITREASLETGLKEGTPVVFGGADQVMQAIGNGVISPSIASVNIGTGGQIFMPLSSPLYDKKLRAHTFSFFAPSTWYYMGAALSSGLSLKWGRSFFGDEKMSFPEIDSMCESAAPGADGLVFLPYLTGERTPCMDPYAKAVFFGLTLSHTKAHAYRSIMEGVAFSLRDALEILTKDLGQECNALVASGGGASSALWVQILSDVFGRDVYRSKMKEQAAFGAALSAAVGTGFFKDYSEGTAAFVRWHEKPAAPNAANAEIYASCYDVYRKLYASTAGLMRLAGGLE